MKRVLKIAKKRIRGIYTKIRSVHAGVQKRNRFLEFLFLIFVFVLIEIAVLAVSYGSSVLTGMYRQSPDLNLEAILGIAGKNFPPNWEPAACIAGLFAVGLLLYSIFLLIRFSGRIESFQRQMDALEDNTNKLLRNAIEAMKSCFDLQGLSQEDDTCTLSAITSVGYGLNKWVDHIKKNENDAAISTTWMNAMEAYHCEEAVEIGKGVLATHARCFPFLILSTLDAFVKNLPSGATACYYALTPANPKDMYNWPHGFGVSSSRKYYEEDFMGVFYRVLREALNEYGSTKIEHCRFVLGLKDVLSSIDGEFGWLPDHVDALKNGGKTLMIPMCMPVKFLLNSEDGWLNALGEYVLLSAGSENRNVIPMFCPFWNHDKMIVGESVENTDLESHLKALSSTNPEALAINNLVKKAKKYWADGFAEAYEKVKSHPLCGTEISEASDYIKSNSSRWSPQKSLVFLRRCHDLEAVAESIKDENAIRNLRLSFLRYRDGDFLESPDKLSSLDAVFSKYWHSHSRLSKITPLSKRQVEEWNLPPEFSAFGIRYRGQKTVDWKLVIATELDYPFDSALIRIIKSGDDEYFRDEKKVTFEAFTKRLNALIENDEYKSDCYYEPPV